MPERMQVSDFTRLYEAQEWLRENVMAGAICPCCHRVDKVYKRVISRMQVECLYKLYEKSGDDGTAFYHATEFLEGKHLTYGEWPKFRFMGLLEQELGRGGQPTGRYRITDEGNAFCQNEITIPVAMYIYRNELLELDEQYEDIDFFAPGLSAYSECR